MGIDKAHGAEAQPIDFRRAGDADSSKAAEADDLLSQFESVNDLGETKDGTAPQDDILRDADQQADGFRMSDTIQAGNLGEAFPTERKPGLDQTVVMPESSTAG